ncbi:hypothetical protein SCUCBS95973_009929 [Sporothrix curviconia]|uniref:Uncharacterized protein n=1 Tax=Sporothrix curviconia TaxID=1260050 RepID=A0ABP0CZZ9_9PEZI
MVRLSALVASLFCTAALAVPNVTVVPLGTTNCSSWPGFLASGDRIDTSSHLQLTIAHSDDAAVDGLYAAEALYRWPAGRDTPDGFNYTALAFDLRTSLQFARIYFQCFDGVLRLGVHGNGTPPLKTTDLPSLGVNKDQRNGFLIESRPELNNGSSAAAAPYLGYPVEPYRHVDAATNKTLSGVFLGARNQTTWGFNFNDDGPCGTPFIYEARLQGLPEDPDVEARAAYDPWFFGFIEVITFD